MKYKIKNLLLFLFLIFIFNQINTLSKKNKIYYGISTLIVSGIITNIIINYKNNKKKNILENNNKKKNILENNNKKKNILENNNKEKNILENNNKEKNILENNNKEKNILENNYKDIIKNPVNERLEIFYKNLEHKTGYNPQFAFDIIKKYDNNFKKNLTYNDFLKDYLKLEKNEEATIFLVLFKIAFKAVENFINSNDFNLLTVELIDYFKKTKTSFNELIKKIESDDNSINLINNDFIDFLFKNLENKDKNNFLKNILKPYEVEDENNYFKELWNSVLKENTFIEQLLKYSMKFYFYQVQELIKENKIHGLIEKKDKDNVVTKFLNIKDYTYATVTDIHSDCRGLFNFKKNCNENFAVFCGDYASKGLTKNNYNKENGSFSGAFFTSITMAALLSQINNGIIVLHGNHESKDTFDKYNNKLLSNLINFDDGGYCNLFNIYSPYAAIIKTNNKIVHFSHSSILIPFNEFKIKDEVYQENNIFINNNLENENKILSFFQKNQKLINKKNLDISNFKKFFTGDPKTHLLWADLFFNNNNFNYSDRILNYIFYQTFDNIKEVFKKNIINLDKNIYFNKIAGHSHNEENVKKLLIMLCLKNIICDCNYCFCKLRNENNNKNENNFINENPWKHSIGEAIQDYSLISDSDFLYDRYIFMPCACCMNEFIFIDRNNKDIDIIFNNHLYNEYDYKDDSDENKKFIKVKNEIKKQFEIKENDSIEKIKKKINNFINENLLNKLHYGLFSYHSCNENGEKERFILN